jgi:hypothetical protein
VKLQQLVAAFFRDRKDPSAPFRGIARHGKHKARLSQDPDGVDVLLSMERPREGRSGNLPQEFQGHDLLLMGCCARRRWRSLQKRSIPVVPNFLSVSG